MRLDVEDVGRSWGQLSAWDRWTGKGRKREEEATDVFTCETVFRRRGGLGVDCVGARGEIDTYSVPPRNVAVDEIEKKEAFSSKPPSEPSLPSHPCQSRP